jgi:hypothetical protein
VAPATAVAERHWVVRVAALPLLAWVCRHRSNHPCRGLGRALPSAKEESLGTEFSDRNWGNFLESLHAIHDINAPNF